MTTADKADWLIPAGLLILSAMPTVAGILRVVQMAGAVEIGPGNAWSSAAPVPAMLHILSSVVFCALGAFRFSPGLRRRYPDWHRRAAPTLVPFGLIAALAGVWMAQFYPAANTPLAGIEGPFVLAIRVAGGSAMALALCLGVAALHSREIPRHRTWTLRSYALGLGVGMQVVAHLPWHLLPNFQAELGKTLLITASWALNLAVAEWSISLDRRRHSTLPGPTPTPHRA